MYIVYFYNDKTNQLEECVSAITIITSGHASYCSYDDSNEQPKCDDSTSWHFDGLCRVLAFIYSKFSVLVYGAGSIFLPISGPISGQPAVLVAYCSEWLFIFVRLLRCGDNTESIWFIKHSVLYTRRDLCEIYFDDYNRKHPSCNVFYV